MYSNLSNVYQTSTVTSSTSKYTETKHDSTETDRHNKHYLTKCDTHMQTSYMDFTQNICMETPTVTIIDTCQHEFGAEIQVHCEGCC